MNGKSHDPGKKIVETSAECAPVVLGVAAGIVMGDMMHRSARRPLAFALTILGAAAIAPTVMDALRNKVSGPNTQRGTERTLQSIREGAGAPARDIAHVKEELGDMYVGYAHH